MTTFTFDLGSPVVRLCIAGSQAEYAGRAHQAHALYLQAWDACRSDYDACIAAHYVARHQPTSADTLHWNRLALAHADSAGSDNLRSFYPSLYLNLAKSYEELGREDEAKRYYELAVYSASLLSDPGYSAMVGSSDLLKYWGCK